MSNPVEVAAGFASGLQGVLDEIHALRESNNAFSSSLDDLKERLSLADQWNRRLKQKCDALEREPVVMDGWDEVACWENLATVQFRDSLTGTAKVIVKGRNIRRVVEVGEPGTPLLRRALNSAFRRTRKDLATHVVAKGRVTRAKVPPGAKLKKK